MGRPQFKRGDEIDKQLEDLVKASSWKQAITLCEKRLKKGGQRDAALVRATGPIILIKHDQSHELQGSVLNIALVGRKSSRSFSLS